MTATLNHPPKEQLVAFGLGKLAPDESRALEQHLEECRTCCETMLSLEDDTFVGLVRKCDTPLAGPDITGATLAPQSDGGLQSHVASGGQTSNGLKLDLQQDRYEILELIGRGGMGDVYRAQHKLMNRQVALKVIKPQLVRNEAAVQRFRREVQAAARLHHRHIVTAHDADRAGDLHFLVMEFVEGTSLDEVVRQRGPLPVAESCRYTAQAAEALEHAHALGMVHRDIKPHNLMVTAGGEVKVLDFGLATFATEVAEEEVRANPAAETAAALHQLTQMGTMMGTPDYIAPEQAANAHAADIRADIYSLGCTLYTLLAGKAPFDRGSVLEKIKAHQQEAPPPVSQLRSDVPRELETVLVKMMAKDPAERYQTPAEVVQALAAFTVARNKPPQPKPPVPRRPIRIALAMFGATAAVIAAGVILYLATDTGRLEIHAEAPIPGARVVLLKDGKEYASFDVEPGKKAQIIRAGQYEIALRGAPEGADLSAWATKPGNPRDFGSPFDPQDKLVAVYRGGGLLIEVGRKDVVKSGVPSDRQTASAFFQSLGDLKAIVRKTLDDANFSVGSVESTTSSHGTRQQVTAHAELTGEKAQGSNALTALRNKFKALSRTSDAFISSVDQQLHGGVEATNLPYTTHNREGLIRIEIRQLAADKREKNVTRWALVVQAEEWPLEQGSPATTAASDQIEPLFQLAGHTDELRDLDFFAGDTLLASGGADQTFRIWDLAAKKQVYNRPCPHWVSSIAISPDGKLAALGYITVAPASEIELIDLASKERKHLLSGPPGLVYSLDFSPDRKQLVAAGQGGKMMVFNPDSGKKLYEFQHENPEAGIQEATFSPDGKLILSASSNVPHLTLHKAADGTAIHQIKSPNKYPILRARFSDRGDTFVAAAGDVVLVYDAKTYAQIASIPLTGIGHAHAVRFIDDDRHLLISSRQNVLRIVDLQGQIIAERKLDGPVAAKVAISESGKLLATGGGIAKNLLQGRIKERIPVKPRDYDVYVWSLPQNFGTDSARGGTASLALDTRAEPPLSIGMNDEFGMLFEGRLVAPAELSRRLDEALKENPERPVAIDLPKRPWTVVEHVDQLEQIARISGAKHIIRPEWAVIRIRFGVINAGQQYLDIKGPNYSAAGFVKSYLPNVREVIEKNPRLPVHLEVATGVELSDSAIAEGFNEVRRIAEAAGAKVQVIRVPPAKSDVSESTYFRRLAGEPLESAVRERVGGDVGRKITSERIPQPAGRLRYEATIDGVGSKIIDHVFVDLCDLVMRGTDAKVVHQAEQGIGQRLLRYTTPAHNGEVRITLTSRELGGQPADESTRWLMKIEASEWAKGASQATPSVVRVEGAGDQMKLFLDGAPLAREQLLARLDALATGDPGFQVRVEGDVVPVSKAVLDLIDAIGATAVGKQNVKFPSDVTQRIMDEAVERGKRLAKPPAGR